MVLHRRVLDGIRSRKLKVTYCLACQRERRVHSVSVCSVRWSVQRIPVLVGCKRKRQHFRQTCFPQCKHFTCSQCLCIIEQWAHWICCHPQCSGYIYHHFWWTICKRYLYDTSLKRSPLHFLYWFSENLFWGTPRWKKSFIFEVCKIMCVHFIPELR